MSSYKGHTVFAIILSFLMFYNPLTIALAVIGANFPDFDHEFKQNQVLTIFTLGLIIAVFLYFLKLPYYLGLILVSLSLIFLFSSHRGFTHSILGMLLQGILVFFLLFFWIDLIMSFNPYFLNSNLSVNLSVVFILLAFLGVFFLNKKLSIPFVVFIILSIVLLYFGIIPNFNLDWEMVLFSIFLGLFSHMILDSFTPSGIKPFHPFSQKKYYKKFGILLFVLVILLFIAVFPQKIVYYYNLFPAVL